MSQIARPLIELDLLQQRLEAHGLQPAARRSGARLHWQGLRLGLGNNNDIELSVIPHPLAVQYGFMLFVGGTPEQCQQAKPLLDALAPAPDAWLWCGPPGAGQFCRRVFDVFIYLNGPILGEMRHDSQLLPDWQRFFAQQLTLAGQLLALAQQYRRAQQDENTPELLTLLQDFARPPAQQPHYALTLARLLDVGLSQQHATQSVFTQLLPATAAVQTNKKPPLA